MNLTCLYGPLDGHRVSASGLKPDGTLPLRFAIFHETFGANLEVDQIEPVTMVKRGSELVTYRLFDGKLYYDSGAVCKGA